MTWTSSSTRRCKWARLALAGNPTVLLVLFVPGQDVAFRSNEGARLTDNAHRIVSRLAARRFLGYLYGQRAMTGASGAHTNRPELVAVHGYDTKYAMHALRLGLRRREIPAIGGRWTAATLRQFDAAAHRNPDPLSCCLVLNGIGHGHGDTRSEVADTLATRRDLDHWLQPPKDGQG